jgi:hypothetical protein
MVLCAMGVLVVRFGEGMGIMIVDSYYFVTLTPCGSPILILHIYLSRWKQGDHVDRSMGGVVSGLTFFPVTILIPWTI